MVEDAGTEDVYEITRLVTPVKAASSLLLQLGPLSGFTNGKSFFFTDEQVELIRASLPDGQLRRRQPGGWEEVVPGKGVRVLAERHIDGGVYFRFRKHWDFHPLTR